MLNLSIVEIIYIFYFLFQDGSINVLVGDRYEINKQLGILIIKNVIKDDEGVYKCDVRNEVDSVVELVSFSVISKNFILLIYKKGEFKDLIEF